MLYSLALMAVVAAAVVVVVVVGAVAAVVAIVVVSGGRGGGRQGRTQLVTASGSRAAAGDRAEALRAHHRCSMGAGAATPEASISAKSCSMY